MAASRFVFLLPFSWGEQAFASYLRLGRCDDGDSFAIATGALKADFAVRRSKQRVVAAFSHIDSGMNTGATLAHNDGAGFNFLAAESLYAQPLRITVTAVARAANAFFMGHIEFP